MAKISETVGRLSALTDAAKALRLRRINRIRTIRGSLAIEGNTLSEEQITAILDGKLVIAPPREIQEARNAITAYDRFEQWRPEVDAELLEAHRILMAGLIDEAGAYRRGGVGVMAGGQVIHMAPPADRVPALMHDLLQWLGASDQHPLIASSVFHYEFEFIHPFADGNGRMGRLWQTLILTREELQSALGLQDRKSFRERYLKPALAEGLIEMTIPGKPNSRLQKYRLTDKGRRWLLGQGGR
ncbi:MAG: Fic family protein [Deltaproteobacteria bacterium]|nr:Fic family protein [Deltaproteobacteria bacterium]